MRMGHFFLEKLVFKFRGGTSLPKSNLSRPTPLRGCEARKAEMSDPLQNQTCFVDYRARVAKQCEKKNHGFISKRFFWTKIERKNNQKTKNEEEVEEKKVI